MQLRAFGLAALLVFTGASAQNSAATPRIAPGTSIEPAKTFDHMLSGFEKELMAAARAMPADKYSFAPGPALFSAGSAEDFKGVRTFAQQLTHIAQANYYYASAVGGLKIDADLKSLDKLSGKEEVLAAVEASFRFTHLAFANLTQQNAFESIRETDTRASLAGGLVAHGFDHYGQMVEYLRMNGLKP